MTGKENKDGPRKEPSEDYYSGYYWGNEPYDSSHITDARKSDDQLKKSAIVNLRKNDKFDHSHIDYTLELFSCHFEGKRQNL